MYLKSQLSYEHNQLLIKAYIQLSSTLQYYGASANEEFGEVEEIAIAIKIKDIYEKKSKRHISTYQRRRS